VAFSPSGREALTGGPDGVPKLWDIGPEGPPRLIRTFGGESEGHRDFIRAVAIHPDGATAITGDASALKVWDMETGLPIQTSTEHKGFHSIEYSPDGEYFLTSSEDAVIRLWSAASTTVLRELRGHTGVRLPAVFSSGECQVVSAGDDGRVILWDTRLCE
jgi:WD40 repeat protein